MLTIIHGADFHLDSPFSGLTPERAAQRRREQRQLLDRLSALAREREADLVLLAGDLFDSRLVYRETAAALARALGDIPCPVFIAPGNHDPMGPGSVYHAVAWPENVRIFSSGDMEAVPLPRLGCTVYGRAFQGPRDDSRPLARFRAAGEGLHIAVLHGEVDTHGGYAPISREEIAATGLDYAALGHVHRGTGLVTDGPVPWAYPGCPEGRGFDETGDKGVLVVRLDGHGCRGEFVPLCRRRYRELTVDLTACPDPAGAVEQALTGMKEDICRVTLTGVCREGLGDLEALEARLASCCFGLTLRDRTRVGEEIWARAREDSLTGLFLRDMEERCRQTPEDPLLGAAVRFGLAALEGGEDPCL